jgi:hypothetical protein
MSVKGFRSPCTHLAVGGGAVSGRTEERTLSNMTNANSRSHAVFYEAGRDLDTGQFYNNIFNLLYGVACIINNVSVYCLGLFGFWRNGDEKLQKRVN